MDIRIMTDTGSDLTQDDKAKYDIIEIPMMVYFSDEEKGDFWEKIIQGKIAKTSQPSPELFKKEFLRAKEENYILIYISIASYLSSTYESANNIKNQIGYENIYIIDSLTASLSERLLVLEACKNKDKMNINDLINYLNEFKKKIKLYACIDSLKHLYYGGRISRFTTSIGSLINIKPIISLSSDGLKVVNKAIGNTRAVLKLIEIVKKENLNKNYKILPIYSYLIDNCEIMVNKMKKNNLSLSSCLPIGSTIGAHIGPYGFGIVYVVS